jgi:hypothetical protein
MVKKVLAALVVIAAVAIYLTIQEEGTESAFGGAFAPVESVRAESSNLSPTADPMGVMTTGNSIPHAAQSDYGQLVDRVRTRTNDAMARSVDRAGGRSR